MKKYLEILLKPIIVFFLVSTYPSISLHGQSLDFEKYYSEEGTTIEGSDMLMRSDGNYLISGFRRHTIYSTDIYTTLVDKAGNKLWSKTYLDSISNDYPLSAIETSDGNFVLAGFSAEPQDLSKYLLLKINSSGELLWINKHSHGDGLLSTVSKVIEAKDQSLILVGNTGTYGGRRATILKYNQEGEQIWSKIVGEDSSDNVALDVVELSNGGFLISGWRDATETTGYLLWVDNEGNLLQSQLTTLPSMYTNLIEANDGNILIGGHRTEDGLRTPILKKIDANGKHIWIKTYRDGNNYSWGSKIIQNQNEIFLAGNSEKGINRDLWLLKLNENGEEIYRKFYGDDSSNGTSSFIQLENNYLGILSSSEEPSADGSTKSIYLLKIEDETSTLSTSESALSKITISPNPSNGIFHISIPSFDEFSKIQVTNIMGSQIYNSQIIQSDISVNLSGYAAGVYVMSLTTQHGEVNSKKIILR